MNRKIKRDFSGKIYRKERHFRWDWEPSPNKSDDKGLIRYHLISVDDKDPQKNIDKLLQNMQSKSTINHSFDPIGTPVSGSVEGTDLKYLYLCYDSECTTHYLDFAGVAPKFKRDERLGGREVIQVKDYLERTFGPND